jgi:hypothetical protein
MSTEFLTTTLDDLDGEEFTIGGVLAEVCHRTYGRAVLIIEPESYVPERIAVSQLVGDLVMIAMAKQSERVAAEVA